MSFRKQKLSFSKESCDAKWKTNPGCSAIRITIIKRLRMNLKEKQNLQIAFHLNNKTDVEGTNNVPTELKR